MWDVVRHKTASNNAHFMVNLAFTSVRVKAAVRWPVRPREEKEATLYTEKKFKKRNQNHAFVPLYLPKFRRRGKLDLEGSKLHMGKFQAFRRGNELVYFEEICNVA
jgi:hypothetical protein